MYSRTFGMENGGRVAVNVTERKKINRQRQALKRKR